MSVTGLRGLCGDAGAAGTAGAGAAVLAGAVDGMLIVLGIRGTRCG
jgi:hypothetical protein